MKTAAIDWETIRLRLENASADLARGFQPSPEESFRILEARARAAARTPAGPDEAERVEVLAFSLAGETYGVETRHVRTVCKLKDITALPCTPPFMAGVINLHGQVLAVIDLRQFFELPARGLTELNRVIVIYNHENEFGLLADSIDGLRRIALNDMQDGLATLTGIRERFLRGVAAGMMAVLDGERLLADPGLKVNGRPSQYNSYQKSVPIG